MTDIMDPAEKRILEIELASLHRTWSGSPPCYGRSLLSVVVSEAIRARWDRNPRPCLNAVDPWDMGDVARWRTTQIFGQRAVASFFPGQEGHDTFGKAMVGCWLDFCETQLRATDVLVRREYGIQVETAPQGTRSYFAHARVVRSPEPVVLPSKGCPPGEGEIDIGPAIEQFICQNVRLSVEDVSRTMDTQTTFRVGITLKGADGTVKLVNPLLFVGEGGRFFVREPTKHDPKNHI